MLPSDVVDRMFRFVHIGVDQDRVPVDLGSLYGCIGLPDRKRLVYSLLSAAVGKFDCDRVKDNQQRAALKSYLSQYLKDKHDCVDLAALTENLRSGSVMSPRVCEVLCSKSLTISTMRRATGMTCFMLRMKTEQTQLLPAFW